MAMGMQQIIVRKQNCTDIHSNYALFIIDHKTALHFAQFYINTHVYLQIDLQKVIAVHGVGTAGDYSDECWASDYHLHSAIKKDEFKVLEDISKTEEDGTHPARVRHGCHNQ